MIKTTYILYQLGNYHISRLQALEGKINLNVIALSNTSSLREWKIKNPLDCQPLFNNIATETNASILLAIRNKLEELNPDVLVISGYFHIAMREAVRWAKQHNKKTVLLSESNQFDTGRNILLEKLKGMWIRKYYDACFVGGTSSRQYYEKLGFDVTKIWTGYDVIDNNYFYKWANFYRVNSGKLANGVELPKKYFLYVGRFSAEKNLLHLLKAFKTFSSTVAGMSWHLVLTGGGPQENELRNYCNTQGICNIVWTGFQQIDSLPIIYSRSSLFILPSIREPWGLVVNEAMACGLPLIVSNKCGSVADLVVQGLNGWIIDPESIENIYEALMKAALNEDKLKFMGHQSLKLIDKYSPENSAISLVDCIKTVCMS